ncbi:MAG: flagellar export chaperone FlgN [Deltaproteobacteria bacterium]|nr:flagellar export chaperone FlgN [Deltaproteobacteria bacterium]RLB95568.1 MAG: hypothetical protein DRH50_03815 [Deltaproteobacteria bacterium]RLC11853.1 MAG: hypothetical protein DRH43_03205 [Deltaproteobacteria bacterium]
MDETMEVLKGLFHEKMLLYQELVACLKREHRALFSIDVDTLWKIAEEKESVVSEIEGIRGRILSVLSEASIVHGMDTFSFDLMRVYSLIPGIYRGSFKNVCLSIARLGNEARTHSRENRLFIEECLGFLDDLIAVIADTGRPGGVYDNGDFSGNKGQVNLLLHREV